MRVIFACVIAIGWLSVASAATTNTWLPTADTNNWFEGTNWSEGTVPANGEEIVITNSGAYVLLTNSSTVLGSFALKDATLIFTNWTTVLTATNITIQTNGVMTSAGPMTNTVMSNRVYLVCSNLTIDAGGKIDVNGKGYAKENGPGYGRDGSGLNPAGGATYGGMGGYAGNTNLCYGSAGAPVSPGSGGGDGNVGGGAGGGVIRVEASGRVNVNGLLSANGADTAITYCGGGSGGSIYVLCATFSGTNTSLSNGLISATGSRSTHATKKGGGGGGGRIAIIYTNNSAQSSLPVPTVKYSASGGTGKVKGDIGTVFFPGTLLLSETLTHNGQLVGFTNWAPDSLTISNGQVRFADEGLQLHVANDVLVTGDTNGNYGWLELGGLSGREVWSARYLYNVQTGPSFSCGGNLTLTNGGLLSVYLGPTNAVMPDYGALVDITGNVYIAYGSWIYPWSHPTNGWSVLFRMNDLNISTGAGFNANYTGYIGGQVGHTTGYGPGGGKGRSGACGGGSYGGMGGQQGVATSACYGVASAPIEPGSGGGQDFSQQAGNGGGVIRVEARGTVNLNGLLTANGEDDAGKYCAAGSGGGIYIRCATFSGTNTGSSNGVISAGGGKSAGGFQGGGGGGGRMAIVYTNSTAQALLPVPTVKYYAAGGSGVADGDIGTISFPGTLLLTETLSHTGQIVGFSYWAPDNLIVSNGWVRFSDEGVQISVSNDVLVTGISPTGSFSRLELGGSLSVEITGRRYIYSYQTGPVFSCGGNLTLTNGGILSVYAGRTNEVMTNYNGSVSVAGNMYIAGGCWVYPSSHLTNGGSILFSMNDLVISSNGGFNADETGYKGGQPGHTVGFGPGGGGGSKPGHGGSYGGLGGGETINTYGDSNAPSEPGSGGFEDNIQKAGDGGGNITIQARGRVEINGLLTANGETTPGQQCGAGSGGSIYIYCLTFAGTNTTTNAVLSATGGNSTHGNAGNGGGGGRIAVWRAYDKYSGGCSNTVSGGIGIVNGDQGSMVWMVYEPPRRGTFFWIN